jgi:hypothetical protein
MQFKGDQGLEERQGTEMISWRGDGNRKTSELGMSFSIYRIASRRVEPDRQGL